MNAEDERVERDLIVALRDDMYLVESIEVDHWGEPVIRMLTGGKVTLPAHFWSPDDVAFALRRCGLGNGDDATERGWRERRYAMLAAEVRHLARELRERDEEVERCRHPHRDTPLGHACRCGRY